MKVGLCVFGLLLFLVSGCAETKFLAYSGQYQTYQGNGGAREVIEGIDFWETGTPPMKFVIHGVINDQRPGGVIPMAQLKADIAKKAKDNGGDAVMLIDESQQVTGMFSHSNTSFDATAKRRGTKTDINGTASTSGFSTVYKKNKCRYVVLKYVD